MNVNIKTSDWKKLEYETEWACAFDFKTTEDVIFKSWDFKLIETGVVIEVPKWYVLQTQPRSSTFKKYQLIQTNSVWIIDQDYCWENDTIKFPFLYLGTDEIFIPKDTRIWQWMFIKIKRANFKLQEKMWSKNRWGFWSTGD